MAQVSQSFAGLVIKLFGCRPAEQNHSRHDQLDMI